MKSKIPFPSKEQVAAARRQMRDARKVLNRHMAHKLDKKRTVRRLASSASQAFETWQHDFRTLLAATARERAHTTPEDFIDSVTVAADRMAEVVAARQPPGYDASRHASRRTFRRRAGGASWYAWYAWQELFDSLVHSLAEQTSLNERDVIARAEQIADLAMELIERRRPKTRTRAAA
jgi:hypothetical protein